MLPLSPEINSRIHQNGRFNGIDKPKMPKAIICDLDGPILKTVIPEYLATASTLAEHGVSLSGRDFFDANGEGKMFTILTDRHNLKDNTGAALSPLALRDIVHFRADKILKEDARRNGGPKIPLADGAKKFLEECSRSGIPIGLATSNRRTRLFEKIDDAGEIWGKISAYAGGDEVEVGKPDPEIYGLAMFRLGVKPKECAAVGDTWPDLIAAMGAGINKFFLTNNNLAPFRQEQLPPGGTLVDHIGQVLPILKAESSRMAYV